MTTNYSLSLRARAELERRRRAAQTGVTDLHRYVPYGSNLELQGTTDTEVVMSGAAGTGKSRAALEKIHACALLYPGMRALIVRKTRSSLSESALFTYERFVLGDNHPVLIDAPQRRNRTIYHYPNGSEIVVGGMDRSSRIMSTEYDLIYPQEAIELSEDEYESLTTRLRNDVMPYQQILSDTNPSYPHHWLKKRCDRGQARMIFCRHEDNPRLYNIATQEWTIAGLSYLAKLDDLTGARKERLRYGRWVQAEGAVYSQFDERIHVIDRFEIPPGWKRYRAIDFGFSNPFVCQWWAEDPDGRLYLYREIYTTRRIVSDHAAQINILSEGEAIEYTVSDHDAEDRATLERCGIITIAADKEISPGIQAVQERLRVLPDGKPRAYFFRDALVERDSALDDSKKPVCTLDEFPAYIWPKDVDGKSNKEKPVDMDNHGMDSFRYMVKALDNAPGWEPFTI